MARAAVLTGGCQCGAVRYGLHARPEEASFCHCRMCQRATGGAFAALACLRNADLEWTKGAPTLFESSSIAKRGFCPSCGTPLTFAYNTGGHINVTIGSLDDPEGESPSIHYGMESKRSWLKLCDGWEEQQTGDCHDERAREIKSMTVRQDQTR